MLGNSIKKRWYIVASLTTTAFLCACATGIKPDELQAPEKLTCLDVPQGVEAHEVRGLMKFHWTTRLTPGPYIAEREDINGTYYRAPSGGIYIGRDDLADKPPLAMLPRTFNGGIWVPRDPDKEPHLYTYFSTQEATIVPLPKNASCSNAISVPDPQSKGVSVVAFASGGAIGGATGGAVARAATPNSTMSYGQAAGVGAAGGAIGGMIVAGMINMDVGKIFHQPSSTDPKFLATLKELTRKIVPIQSSSTQSMAPN